MKELRTHNPWSWHNCSLFCQVKGRKNAGHTAYSCEAVWDICQRKLVKGCDLFGHKKRCVGIPLLNDNCVFTCKCCLIKAVAFVLRILCVGVCEFCQRCLVLLKGCFPLKEKGRHLVIQDSSNLRSYFSLSSLSNIFIQVGSHRLRLNRGLEANAPAFDR